MSRSTLQEDASKIDFEGIKIKMRKDNIDELRNSINEKWVEIKIKNYLERFPFLDLTYEDVVNEIMSNDLVASFFAKDPNKQNITEKTIANIIKNLNFVSNFQNYNSKTEIFVVNGEIVNKRALGVKSVDYSFVSKNITYYVTQKYTKGKGGSQDNQFHDVVSFLQNCKNNKLTDTAFLAIVDGDYYTEEKIKTLQELTTFNSFVLSISQLEDFLSRR